jgi:hypothetical protein
LSCGSEAHFRACVKPLGQAAVLLEHQKPPCQLDHAAPGSGVTGSSQPFLATLLAALVWRAGEAPHSAPPPDGRASFGRVPPAPTCPPTGDLPAMPRPPNRTNARKNPPPLREPKILKPPSNLTQETHTEGALDRMFAPLRGGPSHDMTRFRGPCRAAYWSARTTPRMV